MGEHGGQRTWLRGRGCHQSRPQFVKSPRENRRELANRKVGLRRDPHRMSIQTRQTSVPRPPRQSCPRFPPVRNAESESDLCKRRQKILTTLQFSERVHAFPGEVKGGVI